MVRSTWPSSSSASKVTRTAGLGLVMRREQGTRDAPRVPPVVCRRACAEQRIIHDQKSRARRTLIARSVVRVRPGVRDFRRRSPEGGLFCIRVPQQVHRRTQRTSAGSLAGYPPRLSDVFSIEAERLQPDWSGSSPKIENPAEAGSLILVTAPGLAPARTAPMEAPVNSYIHSW